jgi:putative chitinase
MNVTPKQVKLFLFCDIEKATHLANLINEVFPLYELSSALRIQMCLAQMAHESWNFTKKEECLDYKPEALARTWPMRFAINPKATPKAPNSLAYDLAHKPQALANKVYGNRMGNDTDGDGWHFRGGGNIQLTGKGNVTAYAKYKRKTEPDNRIFQDVYAVADLLRKDDKYAMDSACWFLTHNINILPYCDKVINPAIKDYDNVALATKMIQGGDGGLNERKANYRRAKEIFV